MDKASVYETEDSRFDPWHGHISTKEFPSFTYRFALPNPRAKNAKERSSIHGKIRAVGCMATAAASGDDLEPANAQSFRSACLRPE